LNELTIRINEKDINPSAFITKPFEKEQLLETIQNILSR